MAKIKQQLIVPESLWLDMAFAPKDGTKVVVKDYYKNLDIAKWNTEAKKWLYVDNAITIPTHFAYLS